MYGSLNDEKQPLLPVALHQSDSATNTEERDGDGDGDREDAHAWLPLSEASLLFTSLFLLIALLLVLYFPTYLPASFPLSSHIKTLAVGLQTSAWSSLPAPTVIFIWAPHFARPERVALTRYTIFLFYLVGTVAGALLFGKDLRAVVLEVGRDCRA